MPCSKGTEHSCFGLEMLGMSYLSNNDSPQSFTTCAQNRVCCHHAADPSDLKAHKQCCVLMCNASASCVLPKACATSQGCPADFIKCDAVSGVISSIVACTALNIAGKKRCHSQAACFCRAMMFLSSTATCTIRLIQSRCASAPGGKA